jgi:hypothetical protein
MELSLPTWLGSWQRLPVAFRSLPCFTVVENARRLRSQPVWQRGIDGSGARETRPPARGGLGQVQSAVASGTAHREIGFDATGTSSAAERLI